MQFLKLEVATPVLTGLDAERRSRCHARVVRLTVHKIYEYDIQQSLAKFPVIIIDQLRISSLDPSHPRRLNAFISYALKRYGYLLLRTPNILILLK